MSWLFSTPWRLLFWFRMNWLIRALFREAPTLLWTRLNLMMEESAKSRKTDLLCCALLITTLLLSKNFSNSIRQVLIPMLRLLSLLPNILVRPILWPRIWMKYSVKQLRKLLQSFKRQWLREAQNVQQNLTRLNLEEWQWTTLKQW